MKLNTLVFHKIVKDEEEAFKKLKQGVKDYHCIITYEDENVIKFRGPHLFAINKLLTFNSTTGTITKISSSNIELYVKSFPLSFGSIVVLGSALIQINKLFTLESIVFMSLMVFMFFIMRVGIKSRIRCFLEYYLRGIKEDKSKTKLMKLKKEIT